MISASKTPVAVLSPDFQTCFTSANGMTSFASKAAPYAVQTGSPAASGVDSPEVPQAAHVTAAPKNIACHFMVQI
jgi:hypothetical protein